MADEIALLGVAVDSSSAVRAERDIEALAAAGDRATASAKKLGGTWESIRLTPAQLYTANRGLADFRARAAEAAVAATKVDDSWKKATFTPARLYSLNKALSDYKAGLAQARIASDQLAKSNAVQAASHHQVSKAAVGYTKSAKELAFATRNLPAQFTDIAISLQAGQNPLTVLLQQGGQLKDMFGGVGLALRAVGGYILGLITPLTVAAGAVGLLTVAWIKGDSEARKLQATLALQGNTLGVTTSDLIAASEEMARFGQTQGAAAEALNATAASGKIFGDNIKLVAQAAMNLEREGGQAVEKTVEDFASLADKPLEAALKLDEQYKFLTVSVYEQIRALEEQGDTLGATQVATEALADTVNRRTEDVSENLGVLQKSWRGIIGAAKAAWDAMLNIGREDSVQDQMSALSRRLQAAQTELGRFKPGSDQARFIQKTITELRSDYAKLSDEYVAGEKKAAQEQREEQGRQAAISLAEMARLGQTNSEKRVAERARIEAAATRAIEGIVAANSEDRIRQEKVIRENEAKAIEAMERRLADPKSPRPKKTQEAKDAERLLRDRARDYESLDRALDNHEQQLKAAGDAQDRLSSFERFAIKTLSDLDNGHTALDIAQRKEIKTRIEGLLVIDRENQAREKEAKLLSISADLHARIGNELAAQGQAHNREMLGIGRGQNEGSLAMTLEDIRIRALQERIKLEKQYAAQNAVGSAQYLADLNAINNAEAQLAQNEINQLERKKAAMSDWRNGARSAMEDIAWEMSDVAGRTRDGFLSSFSAMHNALVNFSKNGKASIKDFATTVISELLRIALTIAANKILMAFLGPQITNVGTGPSTYTDNAGFGASDGSFSKGAAFSNGNLVAFARGGLPFGGKGGVRTSPTLFAMANGGTGLMSEHRAEAVMPLERGPSGKLGVIARGGGGTTVTNFSTVVNINQDGSATSQSTSDGENSKDGKRFAELLDRKIRQVIADERRQGGTLWAMQNGR